MHWTYPKRIFLGLLIILILGAILLYLPISFRYESYEYIDGYYEFRFNNHKFSFTFFDSLLLTASAFTDTGISNLVPGVHLTFFGQFIIYGLIQLGGFGYASLFYLLSRLVIKVTKKRFFSSAVANIEKGGVKIADSSSILVTLFFLIAIIQIFFGFIFSFIIYDHDYMNQETFAQVLNNQANWNNLRFEINGINYNINRHDLANNQTALSNIAKLLPQSFDALDENHLMGRGNYAIALWQGLFLSASAINNAGFNLFASNSLDPFRNGSGTIFLMMVLFLTFIGGIGFPVVHDIYKKVHYFFHTYISYKLFKIKKYEKLVKPRLNSFSKACLYSYFAVLFFSLLFTFIAQYLDTPIAFSNNEQLLSYLNGNQEIDAINLVHYPNEIYLTFDDGKQRLIKPFGNEEVWNKNFSIFFVVFNARSSGFASVDLSSLTKGAIISISIFMFIGASPSSTAGGIRTTTLFVIYRTIVSSIQGYNKTNFNKRVFSQTTVIKAFLILFAAIVITLGSVLLLYYIGINNSIDRNYSLKTFGNYFFEVNSLFGTAGLTIGIAGDLALGWAEKLIIISLMFIGQLGIGNMLLLFARKVPKKQLANYLETEMRLG